MISAERFPKTTTEFIETLDSESFKAFLHALSQEKKNPDRLISITLPIAPIDPLVALEQHSSEEDKFYWDHPVNKISISAAGKVSELRATGQNRFDEISEKTNKLKKRISAYTSVTHNMAGPLFLGGYSFGDHNVGKIWKRFGAARFVLPEWILVKSGHRHMLTLILERKSKAIHDIYMEIIERVTDFLNISGRHALPAPAINGNQNILCNMQSAFDKPTWLDRVDRAKDLIHEKAFEKIVLARSVKLKSKHNLNPTLLSYHLREKYPECYNFIIQIDKETSFIGATPERLASFEDGTFKTEGLAGSTSRGKSASEDAALAQSLLDSHKDRIEHQFVVRAIDNSLAPYSYRVEHPNKPQIKKLNNVQHLFTPISATIKSGVKIHDLVQQLHPTPAVGGFPRENAVPFIQEIEQIERGWYAAPVGWYNLNGCGEFAVAIRSALLHKNNAHLFAGCGIVGDSDPESEWQETLMKFQPITTALNEL
ncbi:isochorismate synthase [Rhodohalobacter sp. SW132]|uniref:isochorismate synthase n=1 Tax=Rhodohalobacter sp. SW132 TaxID=2293433 RepID=UPI000E23FE8F|nr:isochorismate synthase [Rhodohalobacter sp. SW132]REL24094.1 isochorismate synthase [Rhodohalobacter sp. SW132]